MVTNNDDAYRTAIALKEAGLSVPCIVDALVRAEGDLPPVPRLGIRVETGKGIAIGQGRQAGDGVALCLQAGEGAVLEEIACEAWPCRRLVAGGASGEPLWRQTDLG